jgi:sugar lactone lactonase YvrE
MLYALGQNSSGQQGVFVFDTSQLKLVHSVLLPQETQPLKGHNGMFLTRDGSTLYVAMTKNIYRIPTATLTASVFAANPLGDVTGFALGANDTKAFLKIVA